MSEYLALLPILLAVTLMVAIAGGLGALARFGVDHGVQTIVNRVYRASRKSQSDTAVVAPKYLRVLGIIMVNVTGAFAVGYFTYHFEMVGAMVVVYGFFGAYTTFSTAMVHVIDIFNESSGSKDPKGLVLALAYLFVPMMLALAAAIAGYQLGS
ncbi:MAG: CrcB family protein [Actinomycetaceae bacterium]|nr:CrcB family protein [Actinomycetaceae bacterium]